MTKRRCKCQICGKPLTVDIAFKIFNGKRNLYYCDEIEYDIFETQRLNDIKNKDELYENICGILGYKSVNTQLFKEMNNLHNLYSWEDINLLLKEKSDSIEQLILENDIDKEYNKIRYIFGALSRNIHDFSENRKKQKLKEQLEFTRISQIELDEAKEIAQEELEEQFNFKSKECTDFSNIF